MYKLKKCKTCGNEFKQYNSLQRCPCVGMKLYEFKKTPIKKESAKRIKLKPVYEKVRIEVLTEAKFKCFIDGCTNVATTAEHRMGRKGFADDWALDNDIPLLVDKRYLAACCSFHNTELENNTALSLEYQLSKVHGGKKIDKR